jgi:iron complex transport system substrate-binding protein
MIENPLAHAASQRIAIIDWAVLETALELGILPIAGTELVQFRKVVVEPVVPPGVADLGLRGSPNYEFLQILRPDLILISNFYEAKRPQLERIATVASLPVYQPGASPYRLAVEATALLGDLSARADIAKQYIADTDAELRRAREVLAGASIRRAFVVVIGDARHLQAFGVDSMFGDVMGRLGIANAWIHGTRYSAAAPVGLETLAADPDAAVVIVAPVPSEFQRTQASNALWQALPAVRRRRVAIIPAVNHFGGLASARRFARLFAAAVHGLEHAP